MAVDIKEWTDDDNIARHLDKETLDKIGTNLISQIQLDDSSREGWLKANDEALKLAEQVTETKTYPWPNASNVAYPLLSTAAIQFHARAFPALLGNPEIVKCRILSAVQDELKKKRADRVSRFMSIQCTELMDSWMEEMDRLLFVLPIVGLCYKKTYQSGIRNQVSSDLLSARDVILNYHASNYERARITHRFWQDSNEIYEFVQAGLYLDVEMGPTTTKEVPGTRDAELGFENPGAEDDTTPYEIYESHCWLDLDKDGYKEPYIVTLGVDSQKVLRIVARWVESGITMNGNKVARIVPLQFFTPYRFLPDPESKVYALGFGRLLGPTNAAVNSLINILMDSGHISTLQAGFLSRGIRVKGGVVRFKPGEWKQVQTTGEDLRNSVFPLPTREPSNVLFQLLGMLISSGKDLSTVQDITVGRNPGQNQPYATTEEVIKQGLKVFNGIYKRVYRSMSKEFQKIYLLNHVYLPGIEYQTILDDPEADIEFDFSIDGVDIVPSAEPDMVMEYQKIQRANALMEKIQMGLPLNPQMVTRSILEAEGHENIDALMKVPPPAPSIEEQELQLEREKFAYQQQKDRADYKLEVFKAENQALRDKANAIATLEKVQIDKDGQQIESRRTELDNVYKMQDQVLQKYKIETDAVLKELQINKQAESKEKKQNAANSGESGE